MLAGTHHPLASLILQSILWAFLILPFSSIAQSVGTTLTLEPHCIEEDRLTCNTFNVLDAEQLITEPYDRGDIVDLDIVLRSSQASQVKDVRAWLSFDPQVLEARSVELTTAIASPMPGEESIDAEQGLIKIGGEVSESLSTPVAVARVTFRVLAAGENTTISFHQYLPTGGGKTAVNGVRDQPTDNANDSLASPPCLDPLIGCETETRSPLLSVRPASLVVSLEHALGQEHTRTGSIQGATAMSDPTQDGSASSSESTQPLPDASTPTTRFDVPPSAFTLLQVQGVQVTTRDQSAYLGWQPLNSSEVTGYNIYYGAVSGRYLQRRSIPPTYSSTVIRDLEPGITYYFAVRGFNGLQEESQFSREVSVVIGQPETATSPLLGSGLPSEPGENVVSKNGGQILTGETGVGTSLVVLLIVSACIGTAFAFRRSFSLARSA